MQKIKWVGKAWLTNLRYRSNQAINRTLIKTLVVLLLIFTLLFSQFSFLIPTVSAASSPWTQTDWSGGSGQTSWSDATKFSSSSNVKETTSGQLTLSVNPYTTRVLAYNPIAYWPMNETSGAVAEDATTNNRDGAYTGVDLGQTGIGDGGTAPWFDGTNDYNDIYSTSFNSAFNWNAGTIMVWFKISNAGIWTNGLGAYPILFKSSATDDYITISKQSTNNVVGFALNFGGVWKGVTPTLGPSINWFHGVLTWDTVANQLKGYVNGTQVGSTQTGLGVPSGGALAVCCTNIGSWWHTGLVWNGWLAHGAVWDTPLSSTQIADLAVVEKFQSSGTTTSSIFDTEQGSNWGTLTYNSTTPANTSVSVKVRTSNNSDMSGATAFDSCIAISSGSDMSSNSCMTDTHRYIQYQATLLTTDTTAS